jgi:crotonobetaine/carnitine-CoA ligase
MQLHERSGEDGRYMMTSTDTFASTWDRAVAQNGPRTFLIFRDDSGIATSWTYAEFDRLVASTAGALRTRGVSQGSAVHVMLRNSPAFVAAWLAVARLGAWMVPVDPASAARDIATQVRRIQPTLGLIGRSRAETYRTAVGAKVSLIELEEDASDLDRDSPLLAGEPTRTAPGVRALDRIAVMFTSGTTSEPKGVVLTQAAYAQVARTMSRTIQLASGDRWFVTLPLFHANAQYYCLAPAIEVGASVAMTASFSASRWISQARELDVTHASLFAAPIRMILARSQEEETPLSLKHVWFAQSLGKAHHAAFGRLVGVLPRQLYGMTETVAIVTADNREPPVHDLIGPAAASRQIRVIDPRTAQLAVPGQAGELQVFGHRGWDLFAEYLDAPGINARVFLDDEDSGAGGSWFRTGDLVVIEPDGNSLRFAGRIDDVIKVAGENVSLTEVEAVIAQAPGVLEAAVVAQVDPVRDQVPVAYVVLKDKANRPLVEELDRFAVRSLAPAARPREWHFIDQLPRTSVGKIQRFRIRTDG